jgi:threonine dehydratase
MAGIWDNKQLAEFNELPKQVRLSLGEGNTHFMVYFSDVVPRGMIGIKDENTNPNGSFKDRSLAYQISMHLDRGKDRFVISSSGNAAISAAAYVSVGGGCLDVFVADTVNKEKLKKLQSLAAKSSKIMVHQEKQAKSAAVRFARGHDAVNLRGSHDDLALPGYKTIAYELAYHDYPDIDALFIPCSSGTSALGILQGFKEVGYDKVKIYLCQTSKVHALAKEFDLDFTTADLSLADAIVDRVAFRKAELIKLLKENGGGGYVISDAELKQVQEKAGEPAAGYSYNSLLGFAGLYKALTIHQRHGLELPFKMPVILASGL